MFSARRRFLALAIAAALGGTVACDSATPEKAPEGEAKQAEQAAVVQPSAAAAAINLEELPFYAKGPIAIVDGAEIPADRFNLIAHRRSQQMPGSVPGQMLQIYKKQTMDIVIDEFLIERKIAADKVEVTPDEIVAALAEFKARFPSEEVYASFLEHNQITEEIIREDIGKDVALRKIVAKTHNLDVTDEKAREFYEEHKHRFAQEEEVQASHILIKLEENADEATVAEKKKLADALAKEARAPGVDFPELARAKSEGPSAPRGGELEFFPRNRMVPEFSKAAFDLKVGEISAPVRTQFGFHIIKVTDRRDERQLPFEEVRETIDGQLKNSIMRDAITEFLADLKKDVKIERKEDNIVVNVPKEEPQMGMPGLDQLQLQMGNPSAGEGHEGHDHDDHAGHNH
ncbi:MAG: peptidylprolyl isomerase [Bradymonadaceae bacterium]|nr:peptidylprolyl isomerase [Lujinxingiaceae bacterium]